MTDGTYCFIKGDIVMYTFYDNEEPQIFKGGLFVVDAAYEYFFEIKDRSGAFWYGNYILIEESVQ